MSHLEALRGYVSREFYYVMTELMARHGWRQIETLRLWNGPGTIERTLLSEFGELPQCILFWEGYELLSIFADDIYRLDCRKFIIADDLHWWDEQMRRRKSVGFALCDAVLSTYAYLWDEFYPEFCGTKRLVWVPHSASPDFMLRYNPDSANSIFLSGAMTAHYPLRLKMKGLHERGSYPITYHPHPGYYCRHDYEEDESVGCGYAQHINACRAGFTDSLIYKYLVAKYFEIPATGALLFADDSVRAPLTELGFIENEHYVPVSEENLEEKIRDVLDESNHVKLDEIRRKGQELVWERHKTSDRAKQIDKACTV
ncbi:MAG: hypothetical protein QOE33_99 [Acidobacteriota bacterium]|nr:hypothetical protein [Acidobacteriota bacterium]